MTVGFKAVLKIARITIGTHSQVEQIVPDIFRIKPKIILTANLINLTTKVLLGLTTEIDTIIIMVTIVLKTITIELLDKHSNISGSSTSFGKFWDNQNTERTFFRDPQ